MTPAVLKESATNAAPPDGLAPTVQALWWAAKDEWDKAHKIVQDDESREAAWVHAYLHRHEGDVENARYWYRQCGHKLRDEVSIQAELRELQAVLTPERSA